MNWSIIKFDFSYTHNKKLLFGCDAASEICKKHQCSL